VARVDDDVQASPAIAHVELKAVLLVAFTVLLLAGFVLFVLYARGVFERTQTVVLISPDTEGISVGANLTFSGFPIGQVKRIDLTPEGKARIEVQVPVEDARWLRTTSVFTLERGLVGGARLRAFTGNLADPALPDGAVRDVLRGDATEQLPLILVTAKRVIENLERMTSSDSSLNASLDNLREVTGRMKGRYGALAGALGSEDNARKLIDALDRSNALLASLAGTSDKLGRALDKTDQRVFGPGGVMDETQKALAQLNGVLSDARRSLKAADAVLAEAQKIGAHTSAATEDLVALRAQVEESLRKLNGLIDEVNRRWPFKHGALGEYEAAYLRGETRVAQVEFARARKAIASTGRIDLVAQAELLRCALRTASLEFDDCPGFAALAADATPAERAYAAYLSGRWQGLDASLLPEPQRAVAARGEGALAAIQDPVSRLVASGALFRAGRLEPAGIAAAVDTASANGWRRPLLAWLGVEQKRAEQAGDRRAAELLAPASGEAASATSAARARRCARGSGRRPPAARSRSR
jgi:phospholipid/cholesterol/gamma-HCH transport system substrate-binding protein